MRGRILAATLAAAVSMVAPAHAAVIQDFSDFTSATNGIVLGPDGNFWVAQEFNDQGVVRMTPSGQFVQRIPVRGDPQSIINGPGGRVWLPCHRPTRSCGLTRPRPTRPRTRSAPAASPVAARLV